MISLHSPINFFFQGHVILKDRKLIDEIFNVIRRQRLYSREI